MKIFFELLVVTFPHTHLKPTVVFLIELNPEECQVKVEAKL